MLDLRRAELGAYARLSNGQVKLHKDGYTDLRGRSDYASASAPDLLSAPSRGAGRTAFGGAVLRGPQELAAGWTPGPRAASVDSVAALHRPTAFLAVQEP